MSKTIQETSNSSLMTSDNGFWFFIPSRECWDNWRAEANLQRDIDNELMLDEIQLFEVGANYES